jgi:hypothetical protein
MAMAQRYAAQQGMSRGGPSGLADVLDVLLDKGLVVDAFVRVSLVGIELLTIDARIVVASVDTYLRFAEAVNRLDLVQANNSQTLGDLVSSGKEKGAKSVTKGALEGLREKLPGGDSKDEDRERDKAEARS